MVSPMDDARAAMRREHPDLLILTGAVHEPSAVQLLRLAREQEVYSLALLEPTDTERDERGARVPATTILTKPVKIDEAVAIARRMVERREPAAAHRHQRPELGDPGRCWSRSSRWRRSPAPC